MKAWMKKHGKVGYLAVVMVLAVASLASARGPGWGSQGNSRGTDFAASADRGAAIESVMAGLAYELPDGVETEELMYMREEEKLARDIYLSFYEIWGYRIFANIAGSEQRHMDILKMLVDKYELADPVADNSRGVFTDPELQALYDELLAAGSRSALDALQVGATIEDLDIFDLDQALARTDNADLRTAYQNLMKGSRNHLRAFAGWLAAYGQPYIAQYLSPEEVESIINASRERGMYDENGAPVARAQPGACF